MLAAVDSVADSPLSSPPACARGFEGDARSSPLSLQVTLIADERSEFDALTRHLVLASGLKHERRSTWTTDAGASTLVDGGTALTAIATSIEDSPDHIARVLARSAGGGLVLATWRFNEVSCRIFAASPADASGLLLSCGGNCPGSTRRLAARLPSTSGAWMSSGATDA